MPRMPRPCPGGIPARMPRSIRDRSMSSGAPGSRRHARPLHPSRRADATISYPDGSPSEGWFLTRTGSARRWALETTSAQEQEKKAGRYSTSTRMRWRWWHETLGRHRHISWAKTASVSGRQQLGLPDYGFVCPPRYGCSRDTTRWADRRMPMVNRPGPWLVFGRHRSLGRRP